MAFGPHLLLAALEGLVTSAVLALTYENGIDILPEKGSMSVYINGSPVADLPLSAFRGPVNASITLPASLMRPGENQIVFQTNAQHRAICTVRGTYEHDPYGLTAQTTMLPALYDVSKLATLDGPHRWMLETKLRREVNRTADILSDASFVMTEAMDALGKAEARRLPPARSAGSH